MKRNAPICRPQPNEVKPNVSKQNLKSAEAYPSYAAYFEDMRALAAEYDDMPTDRVWSAWARASTSNPFIQNSRVKHISTFPQDYKKADIVEMIRQPENNEKELRSVSHALEWGAYPFRLLRTTKQSVNTYRYYHFPARLTAETAKGETVRREGHLLDAFHRAFRPDEKARQAVGIAWQEGKAAFVPRYSVDKSHGKVNYAFWQQLPSDWFKITGFNSESGYTVMFNMLYFLSTPGADWRQFGELFVPFLADFESVLEPSSSIRNPKGRKAAFAGKNTLYGADGRSWKINSDRITGNEAGNPQVYNQNGEWAYWVTLPPESVWVFEIDDTTRAAAPMSTGLFITFDQISQIEEVALAVMQNPLVSLCLGEMELFADRDTNTADPIKLSPAGRATYTAYWTQMLEAFNAGGIALYTGPFKNLHLETLPEATGSSDMTTKEYGYAVLKSGMSGLIPINADPRAGAVNISAKLEEQFCMRVYQQMERMMESIYRALNLKNEWRFRMFGGFLSDEKDLEDARAGLQIGMLSETLRYLALRGISFWEDESISALVKESGVLDLRIPPATSYTGGAAADVNDKGGRPEKTGLDGAEQTSENKDVM